MECPACHTLNVDGAHFCAKCGALMPAQKDETDPLIGSIVGGRFRVLGILGEGGMGRVYTAEQQMGTTARKVAIKTLLSEYARDAKVVERFMRECATVVELEHPNTIKFYDYGKTDAGDLYIAMELLTGSSLEKALEGGALAPDRVDRILSQISGSLQEAHDKGIVHRDLKPANIFLTTRAGEGDYVKVLDFGIAKRDDKHSKAEAKLTQQGTVLGTPPYMSPEQFKGQELDARSDIYSLGVMAYEMLTGRLPFDADTPWAWATQHMTAQPFPFETVPLGGAVPAKMKAAVMRALSKDKAQRQQSAREFFDDFTLGGGAASISVAFGDPPPDERRGGRRRARPRGRAHAAGIPGVPERAPVHGARALEPERDRRGARHVPLFVRHGRARRRVSRRAAGAGCAARCPQEQRRRDHRRRRAPRPAGGRRHAHVQGQEGQVHRRGQRRRRRDGAPGRRRQAPRRGGRPGPPPPFRTIAEPARPATAAATPHEQDCKQAEIAARHDNVEEAQRHLQKCDGPVSVRLAAERAVDALLKKHHCPRGKFCTK